MITDIQRASILKRVAAGIFDGILLCIFAVGFAWMLSSMLNYNSYHVEYTNHLSHYEESYGVKFDISQSEYQALTGESKENYDAAYQALIADESAMHSYNMMLNLALVITTFGILLSIVLLEYIVPLMLKNGQTIGKKIFSIGLIRSDSVQMNHMQLFVRTILGKFTIETMLPVYIVIMLLFNPAGIGIMGLIIIAALLLLQIILLIVTKNNSLIHDMLAGTVAIDISSQMIFRTSEELIAYKEKIHAEQVARSIY